MTSARAPLVVLGVAALALAGVVWHGVARTALRNGEQPAIDAVTRLLPGPDLSFAGSARHLRFPSLEEPGAAFADAPASPDLDPAGAAVAPPTAVFTQIEDLSRRGHPPRLRGLVVPR
jgi:hypothetical protein